MKKSFLSKTMEVAGALFILCVFWIIDIFCPFILAVIFFIPALFIWDYFRNKENDINTNYDDQL